jgi:hypothetical protein
MGATMSNLAEIQQGLEDLGFVSEYKVEDNLIVVSLDGGIPAVLMIENESLSITAQLCTFGELREENLTVFAMAALDANSRISPFAISLITERDDPSITDPSEYVVTLVDHIPLGDFESSELAAAMQSLLTALVGCREVVEAGCAEPVPAE